MRTFRSPKGPYAEQPYYKLEKIEQICRDELQKFKLYPSEPSPVRIDRFIEKRFAIHPTYEDLPEGLLGFTRFGEHGVEEIVVAQALDEEGTEAAERRLRTTLAHESGHGLLHSHLFAPGIQLGLLFGDGLDSETPKILCRDGGVPGVQESPVKKYDGRWWEFQANQAMGSLLLPKLLVEKSLGQILSARGTFGEQVLAAAHRNAAVRTLADIFDVNPVVARIRLDSLYPAADGGQLTL